MIADPTVSWQGVAVTDATERALTAFRQHYGAEPAFVARAPGRVNLIGEHTDYNDGFCLPMALPMATVIAARAVDGPVVSVRSEGYGATAFDLTSDPAATIAWARYVHGVGHLLHADGHPVGAWEGTIASDVPLGASLSSSAALEVAAGLAFLHSGGTSLEPALLARIGQRVENEIFGLPSGILDQLASAASVEGSALLLDCRTLETTPAALPDDAVVVVMDTMSRRELVDSEYADRHATCQRVAAELGVAALRDATLADLERLGPDDSVGRRRAHHVITENQRTLDTVAAFAAGDTAAAGALFTASHASLRDDYEVSGPALDQIVDIAQSAPGCFGARMTGGGFAGCAVALVDATLADRFVTAVGSAFADATGVDPQLWVCAPGAGGSVASIG